MRLDNTNHNKSLISTNSEGSKREKKNHIYAHMHYCLLSIGVFNH